MSNYCILSAGYCHIVVSCYTSFKKTTNNCKTDSRYTTASKIKMPDSVAQDDEDHGVSVLTVGSQLQTSVSMYDPLCYELSKLPYCHSAPLRASPSLDVILASSNDMR